MVQTIELRYVFIRILPPMTLSITSSILRKWDAVHRIRTTSLAHASAENIKIRVSKMVDSPT